MRKAIGITGGIGSGKSVISRILRLNGFEVYDCDSEAKQLMDSSESILDAIRCRYGDKAFTEEFVLCRPYIAERVFASDEERLWLNALVHGAVRDDFSHRLSQGDGALFVESAILRTSGLDKLCDEIWIVTAPEELRLERAVSRDGSDREKVRARMEAQKNEFEFGDESRLRTIVNDGRQSLLPQIEKYITNLTICLEK